MDPMVRTHIGAVLEKLLPEGSPHRICSGRPASHGRDPTLEKGQSDHEGVVEMKWKRWTATSIRFPVALCCSWEGGRWAGRRGQGREGGSSSDSSPITRLLRASQSVAALREERWVMRNHDEHQSLPGDTGP